MVFVSEIYCLTFWSRLIFLIHKEQLDLNMQLGQQVYLILATSNANVSSGRYVPVHKTANPHKHRKIMYTMSQLGIKAPWFYTTGLVLYLYKKLLILLIHGNINKLQSFLGHFSKPGSQFCFDSS